MFLCNKNFFLLYITCLLFFIRDKFVKYSLAIYSVNPEINGLKFVLTVRGTDETSCLPRLPCLFYSSLFLSSFARSSDLDMSLDF